MLPFRHVRDPRSGQVHIETSLRGVELLNTPLLNRACAFDERERHELGLLGLLPTRVESIDEQLQRELDSFRRFKNDLNRNDYLSELHDRNEVLYYRLVCGHIEEMLPILYTPEVGEAVQKYSHHLRRPRGLYISYPEIDDVETILRNRVCEATQVLCATDAGAILGIGDQGVGGMGIPVAKLALDSICGVVDPGRTLPVMLDVGTDNEALREDPLYVGWRHERVQGSDYDVFIEKFVHAVKKVMPHVFFHWEDFAGSSAQRNLDTYRDTLCSFNDDIQGTAAVCVASVYAALRTNGQRLRDQRVVIFGAGAAGLGNAEELVRAMQREGLSEPEARARVYAVDRYGLVVEGMQATEAQKRFARPTAEVADFARNEKGEISLEETVKRGKATVMIGTSTQRGAFSETIVRDMASRTEGPIIFPLSNPTDKAEATPEDLLAWTHGKAMLATGSPFEPVECEGKQFRVGQANNAFIFPGITLGSVAVRASRVSDDMIWAATQALAELSPAREDPRQGLLPTVGRLREVCRRVGLAVAEQAADEGLARSTHSQDPRSCVEQQVWQAEYVPIHPVKRSG